MSQKLAALHAKAKNPKIDMAEQLSKDEMDEFNLLSAQVPVVSSRTPSSSRR